MKKVLASFGVHDSEKCLEVALPTFDKYAQKHGYQLEVTFEPNQLELDAEYWPDPRVRPWSWFKIPYIVALFEQTDADLVLWLDADVMILDHQEDVATFMELDKIQATVRHSQNRQIIANAGVWLLRPAMIPWLKTAWSMTDFIDHGGWEQSAIASLMGADQKFPHAFKDTKLARKTGTLPSRFNWMWGDDGRPAKPSFFHVGNNPNRADIMRDALVIPGMFDPPCYTYVDYRKLVNNSQEKASHGKS